jgi:hypothetical protein
LHATQADNRSVANGAIFLVIFLKAFAQAVSSVPCQIKTKIDGEDFVDKRSCKD